MPIGSERLRSALKKRDDESLTGDYVGELDALRGFCHVVQAEAAGTNAGLCANEMLGYLKALAKLRRPSSRAAKIATIQRRLPSLLSEVRMVLKDAQAS